MSSEERRGAEGGADSPRGEMVAGSGLPGIATVPIDRCLGPTVRAGIKPGRRSFVLTVQEVL